VRILSEILFEASRPHQIFNAYLNDISIDEKVPINLRIVHSTNSKIEVFLLCQLKLMHYSEYRLYGLEALQFDQMTACSR
jgi:hypothetical protein